MTPRACRADSGPGRHRGRGSRCGSARRRRARRPPADRPQHRRSAAPRRQADDPRRQQDRWARKKRRTRRVRRARHRESAAGIRGAQPRHASTASGDYTAAAAAGRNRCRDRARRGHPRRDRRPAERRQVDAGQSPARRGARDRLRDARHDARFDPHTAGARRQALHRSSTRPASAAARASRMRSRSSA